MDNAEKDKLVDDKQDKSSTTTSNMYGTATGFMKNIEQSFGNLVKGTGKVIEGAWEHRPLLMDDGRSQTRLKVAFKVEEPVLGEFSCKLLDVEKDHHHGTLFVTPYHLFFDGEIYNPKGTNKTLRIAFPARDVTKVEKKAIHQQKDKEPEVVPIEEGKEAVVIEITTADKKLHQLAGFGAGYQRAFNTVDHVVAASGLFAPKESITSFPAEYKPLPGN